MVAPPLPLPLPLQAKQGPVVAPPLQAKHGPVVAPPRRGSRVSRRGPMDVMRQFVRLLVRLLPQAQGFLPCDSSDMSEPQIRLFLMRALGQAAPQPDWGVPGGWEEYFALLFNWVLGGDGVTAEAARGCFHMRRGCRWEVRDAQVRLLGLHPWSWPVPLSLEAARAANAAPGQPPADSDYSPPGTDYEAGKRRRWTAGSPSQPRSSQMESSPHFQSRPRTDAAAAPAPGDVMRASMQGMHAFLGGVQQTVSRGQLHPDALAEARAAWHTLRATLDGLGQVIGVLPVAVSPPPLFPHPAFVMAMLMGGAGAWGGGVLQQQQVPLALPEAPAPAPAVQPGARCPSTSAGRVVAAATTLTRMGMGMAGSAPLPAAV